MSRVFFTGGCVLLYRATPATINPPRTSFTAVAVLPLVLLILIGLAFLQAILSKKQNESIGLILPTSTFILSIVLLLTIGVLNNETLSFAEYIGSIVIWFLILNLPTIEYLIIYSFCRKKVEAKKEIEKMSIMDLE